MGNCCSNSPERIEDKIISSELKQEKQDEIYVKKLLFLGAGGSGKSTIFKQLRKIHGDGWDTEYLMSFMQYIHGQIIEQMKLSIQCVMISAEQELYNEYGDDYRIPNDFNPFYKLSSEAQNAAKTILRSDEIKLNKKRASACKILWNDPIIVDIYENRAQTTVEDTSAYFWDKIDDIMSDGYVPTESDVLFVRLRSTGVQEQSFIIGKLKFHIFDVGGQKSERKKWIHCFENVTAMIFVVSLSCYDEVMFEDDTQNSMVDTLQLFENICNNEWFQETSIIVFLNKTDLFQIKLQENKPITLCPDFADYEGDEKSFEESTTYIQQTFNDKNHNTETKGIYLHLTCATDKENVKKVFIDVQSIVVDKSLRDNAIL